MARHCARSAAVKLPCSLLRPHSKEASVQVELAQKYLDNGAQPTPRVVKLLATAGVKLPTWVVKAENKTKTTRNADKLRKNQPKEDVVPAVADDEPKDEAAEEIVDAAEPAVEPETEAADAGDGGDGGGE